MTYAECIRYFRKLRDLRLVDVAHHLGVSVPYVADVERGKRHPLSNAMNLKLAGLLVIPAADLLVKAAEARGFFEVPCEALSDKQMQDLAEAVVNAWWRKAWR